MRKKRLVIAVAFAIMSSMIFSTGVLAEDPELPSPPSLADKMKDPNFKAWAPASTPLPESEITRIAFPMDWILKNDADPDPWYVRITFPESWIKNQPVLPADEKTVTLSVPTRLLLHHNQSRKADEFTVSFAIQHFEGLSVPERPLGPVVDVTAIADSPGGTKAIQYEARRWYEHATGEDDITGALGFVTPYEYDPGYETFFTYHEIEFGGNTSGDWVEIIRQVEHVVSRTRVFFCFVDNNVYNYPQGLTIDVGINDEVYYEFYVDYDPEEQEDYIMGWLEYDGDWYWDLMYESTAPDHYDYFIGSSEIDTKSGIQEDFVVQSRLYLDQLRVDDEWEDSSYVEDALDYLQYDLDYYVRVSHYMDVDGLRFTCLASESP